MNSIRRHLLALTLTATTLGSILIAAVVFQYARTELDELYDAHLQQLALTLLRQGDALGWHADDDTPPVPDPGAGTPLGREENYLIQLWSRQGALHYSSLPSTALPLQPQPGFQRSEFAGESWRIYRADSPGFHVQIAQPEAARRSIIGETALNILLPLGLQIPVLALLAGLAVRRGLRPLNALSNAIKQRHPAALTPLPTDRTPSELRPLVQALNDLLQQLQRALEQQRHFIADAAHELRTPLAALQLQLDLLKRAATEAERARAIADLDTGIRRSTHLVRQLLVTVRSEQTLSEQTLAADAGPVRLDRIAAETVEQLLPLARARRIDLGFTRLENAEVRALPGDMQTLLTNIVDNAIRYTGPDGRVDVAVYTRDGAAVVEVTDTGPGIPVGERGRVFDRFYRIPGSRAEGSGLGLAIVKASCDRYGAALAIDDNPAQSGTRFTIRFAAAQAHP